MNLSAHTADTVKAQGDFVVLWPHVCGDHSIASAVSQHGIVAAAVPCAPHLSVIADADAVPGLIALAGSGPAGNGTLLGGDAVAWAPSRAPIQRVLVAGGGSHVLAVDEAGAVQLLRRDGTHLETLTLDTVADWCAVAGGPVIVALVRGGHLVTLRIEGDRLVRCGSVDVPQNTHRVAASRSTVAVASPTACTVFAIAQPQSAKGAVIGDVIARVELPGDHGGAVTSLKALSGGALVQIASEFASTVHSVTCSALSTTTWVADSRQPLHASFLLGSTPFGVLFDAHSRQCILVEMRRRRAVIADKKAALVDVRAALASLQTLPASVPAANEHMRALLRLQGQIGELERQADAPVAAGQSAPLQLLREVQALYCRAYIHRFLLMVGVDVAAAQAPVVDVSSRREGLAAMRADMYAVLFIRPSQASAGAEATRWAPGVGCGDVLRSRLGLGGTAVSEFVASVTAVSSDAAVYALYVAQACGGVSGPPFDDAAAALLEAFGLHACLLGWSTLAFAADTGRGDARPLPYLSPAYECGASLVCAAVDSFAASGAFGRVQELIPAALAFESRCLSDHTAVKCLFALHQQSDSHLLRTLTALSQHTQWRQVALHVAALAAVQTTSLRPLQDCRVAAAEVPMVADLLAECRTPQGAQLLCAFLTAHQDYDGASRVLQHYNPADTNEAHRRDALAAALRCVAVQQPAETDEAACEQRSQVDVPAHMHLPATQIVAEAEAALRACNATK